MIAVQLHRTFKMIGSFFIMAQIYKLILIFVNSIVCTDYAGICWYL